MPISSPLSKYLQSTKAPWTTLLVLRAGESLSELVKVPAGFVVKSINGNKCRTESALFAEFAQVLHFPDYFGHNWDALEECLADLEWMPAKGYALILTDADQILRQDEGGHATLTEVLSDAGEAWASGQAGMGERPITPFHALFVVTERGRSSRAHWGMEEMALSPAPKKLTPQRRPRRTRISS